MPKCVRHWGWFRPLRRRLRLRFPRRLPVRRDGLRRCRRRRKRGRCRRDGSCTARAVTEGPAPRPSTPKLPGGAFAGLRVDSAWRVEVRAILRGIRAISDYEYELQMALMNRKLQPGLETVIMMPAEK